MNKLIRITIVAVFLLVCNNLYSQNNKIFNIELQELGLEYKFPKGFIDSDTSELVVAAPRLLLGTTHLQLESKDKNIVIAFILPPKLTVEDSVKWGKTFSERMPNRNEGYLRVSKHFADTINGKIVVYPPEKAKWVFNADHAGEYDLRQTIPYHGEYDKCKVVYIQKHEQSFAQMLYFYNEAGADKVDSCIKATQGMLKYKN